MFNIHNKQMGNSGSIDSNKPLLSSCRYLSVNNLGIIIGVDEKKHIIGQRLGDQYLCLDDGIYGQSIYAKKGGITTEINNCKLFALKEFTHKKTLGLISLEYKFSDNVILMFMKGKDFVSITITDPNNNINFTRNMTIAERKNYENVARGESNEFDYIGNFVHTDFNGKFIF